MTLMRIQNPTYGHSFRAFDVYDIFDGVDGMTTDGENQVMLPYVVTIDYDSQAIVSIRRNWEEDDERQKAKRLVCLL